MKVEEYWNLVLYPKDYRKELGLNQEQMSKAMGVHYMTWNKWERGEHKPNATATQLMRLLVCIKSRDPNAYERIKGDCLNQDK